MDEKTQMFGGADDDRTQMSGFDPDRTQMGADPNKTRMGMDPNRTQMGGDMRALSVECVAENRYAFAPQDTRMHVVAKLKAGGSFTGKRMPLNLCLILDVSASMEGAPMEYMKQASSYIVDLLEPDDVLSIVAFEERAQVIMPARRIVNKDLIKQHIYNIYVGNTTNIYEGIQVGANQVASVSNQNYVNRALLFTDGEPTAGNKDFHSIVGQVAEQKSRGITVTALGFGPEYNEELLASIAKRSGGNYYYITRPELIPEVFRKELEILMSTAARNVRLRVKMSRWVQVRQVYNKLPTFGTRTAEVTMSDMERGETQSALIELGLAPHTGGTFRVAQVEAVYDDSATGQTETVTSDVIVQFTSDQSLVEANVDERVRTEIELAEQSRTLEKTVMGMRTQQISSQEAIGELEKTKTMLINQGRTLQAHEVQNAIDEINQGAAAEKTLMGTIMNLEREKGNDK